MAVDLDAAERVLNESYAEVRVLTGEGGALIAPPGAEESFGTIFDTNVQAYRETLLGSALARLLDRTINIRLPYTALGPGAYSARTLDEKIVNPFLHHERIPASRGPFLSVFRRSVRFEANAPTREGLRDKTGYDAFLQLLSVLEGMSSEEELRSFIAYLLFKFVQLRDKAGVVVSSLQRVSLEQYGALIDGLLRTPSGGRLPVMIVAGVFQAWKDHFGLPWSVELQGINEADAATGAGGDITIRDSKGVILAAEVTERPVDRSRLETTFNAKIAPNAIADYLFFVRLDSVADDAREQARRYFAQGHDINFVDIKTWATMCLASMGNRGRDLFQRHLRDLIADPRTPSTIKVAWNGRLADLTAASPLL